MKVSELNKCTQHAIRKEFWALDHRKASVILGLKSLKQIAGQVHKEAAFKEECQPSGFRTDIEGFSKCTYWLITFLHVASMCIDQHQSCTCVGLSSTNVGMRHSIWQSIFTIGSARTLSVQQAHQGQPEMQTKSDWPEPQPTQEVYHIEWGRWLDPQYGGKVLVCQCHHRW